MSRTAAQDANFKTLRDAIDPGEPAALDAVFSGGGGGSGNQIDVVPGATENDYEPTGWADAGKVVMTPAANSTITGFAASGAGTTKVLKNRSAFVITLTVKDAGSVADNQLNASGDVDILPQGTVTLWYDETNTIWGVV